jgi:hypothetical protein
VHIWDISENENIFIPRPPAAKFDCPVLIFAALIPVSVGTKMQSHHFAGLSKSSNNLQKVKCVLNFILLTIDTH